MLSVLTFSLSIFSSCSNEDVNVPDTSTAGRHIRLSGSTGNDNAATRASWTDNNDGKLTFAWDYSASDATSSELKFAFEIKSGSWLESDQGKKVVDAKILQHSDTEKAENRHWAEFETIDTYTDNDYDGCTVYAFTPVNGINGSKVEVNSDGDLDVDLKMPTTFTQSDVNNLEHLSDYMYMSASSVLANGTASLTFSHLAAYVRFKISNDRGAATMLYGVKMELVDANGKAAPTSGSSASRFSYTAAADDAGVQVKAGETGLNFDNTVFLYAPVFPVGLKEPFKDKTLRFTIIAEDPTKQLQQGNYTYLTYELSGETFNSVTGSYDWGPGNLYTFNLKLDDVLKVAEVTVNDWSEEEISGGEAEEAEN